MGSHDYKVCGSLVRVQLSMRSKTLAYTCERQVSPMKNPSGLHPLGILILKDFFHRFPGIPDIHENSRDSCQTVFIAGICVTDFVVRND